MASRELKVEIIGDSRSLQKALGSAGDSATGFGSKFAKAGKVIGVAALGVGAAVAGGLVYTLKRGFDELGESQKVLAQTGAVIKSTGGIANVTAKDVEGLSESLSKMSGVDDEVIASGENMLLTFKNIRNEVGEGNDIFNQTTATMLDLNQVMGGPMEKSAILLGKALNDPIRGMSALTRVGVTFTEGQRETIKSMVESGNAMGAQKLILKELNSEFGGSAKAFGDTMPGQLAKLKNAFDEVAGEMAVKFLPILTGLVEWVNAHWPQISAVFDAVGTAIITSFDAIGVAVEYLRGQWEIHRESAMKAWTAVQTAVMRFIQFFQTTVVPAIQNVVSAAQAVWDHFGGEIITIGERMVASVKQVMLNMTAPIRILLALLKGDWGEAWNIAKQVVTGTLGTMLGNIRAVLGSFISAAKDIGMGIVRGVVGGLASLASSVAAKFGELLGAIANVAKVAYQFAYQIGAQIIGGIVDGITEKVSAAYNKIKELASGLAGAFSSGLGKLKPGSGSEAGREIVQALIDGIEEKRSAFDAAMASLSDAALSAFDKMSGEIQTKSEKALERMRAADARRSITEGVSDARKGLREAKAGDDPQAIINAQKRLNEALRAEQIYNLEQKAIKERTAQDAERERERVHFEKRLENLGRWAQKNPEKHKELQAKLRDLYKDFGLEAHGWGKNLGAQLAQGLRDSRQAIVQAADALAEALRKRWAGKSPPEEGPLSDIDTWWATFPDMLAKQLDPEPIITAAGGIGQALKDSFKVDGVTSLEEFTEAEDETLASMRQLGAEVPVTFKNMAKHLNEIVPTIVSALQPLLDQFNKIIGALQAIIYYADKAGDVLGGGPMGGSGFQLPVGPPPDLKPSGMGMAYSPTFNFPNYVGDKRELTQAIQEAHGDWMRRNGSSMLG